jgi:hypothetical protein
MFCILGVNLMSGKMGRCISTDDPSNPPEVIYNIGYDEVTNIFLFQLIKYTFITVYKYSWSLMV